MRHNGRAAALHAQTLARATSEVSLLMVLVPFCHAQTLARATSEAEPPMLASLAVDAQTLARASEGGGE